MGYEDDYVKFLEGSTPVKMGLQMPLTESAPAEEPIITEDVTSETPEEITEEVTEVKEEETVVEEGNDEVVHPGGRFEQASPNTDPEAKRKDVDSKGPNPDNLDLNHDGGEATPNTDPGSHEYSRPKEHPEPQNTIAQWKGVGQYPSTLNDPMLALLVNKFTATTPAEDGTRDPLREDEDCDSCKQKAAMELLEDKDGVSTDEVKNVLEDASNTKDIDSLEATIINRLIVEMNQIESELQEDFEDDEDELFNADLEDDSDGEGEYWEFDEETDSEDENESSEIDDLSDIDDSF